MISCTQFYGIRYSSFLQLEETTGQLILIKLDSIKNSLGHLELSPPIWI